jgi:hypothetical protein
MLWIRVVGLADSLSCSFPASCVWQPFPNIKAYRVILAPFWRFGNSEKTTCISQSFLDLKFGTVAEGWSSYHPSKTQKAQLFSQQEDTPKI